MDLKNTINNTNTHKENIKQVATQINNKLVELGGEQATNLSDVANKMGAMVTGNYKKIANIEVNKDATADGVYKGYFSLPLNLSFKPEFAIVHVRCLGVSGWDTVCSWDTRKSCTIKATSIQGSFSISELTENNFKCYVSSSANRRWHISNITAIG